MEKSKITKKPKIFNYAILALCAALTCCSVLAFTTLFGGDKNNIKVIGIRHGEKMYETLLTNEECAHAIDMGNFYRVPCDKRGLNYDKYFTKGNTERNTLSEFNSNNTDLLSVEQVKEKLLQLEYIRNELQKADN